MNGNSPWQRKKLPDPRIPCQVHWSPSYSPDSKTAPGGICGRLGEFMMVAGNARWTTHIACCLFHRKKLTKVFRGRGITFRVWRMLKRSAKLYDLWPRPEGKLEE